MSFVIWLTGIPCSGKTTISKKLAEKIPNLAILDGDELREWLSPKDFSKNEIIKHNKKVAHLAKLLVEHSVPVCVALISPYHENRQNARQIVDNSNFAEVYLKCSLDICEIRDVKGMYKKAKAGLIKNFIGLDNRYEVPKNPDLVIDTKKLTVEKSVKKILKYLKQQKFM